MHESVKTIIGNFSGNLVTLNIICWASLKNFTKKSKKNDREIQNISQRNPTNFTEKSKKFTKKNQKVHLEIQKKLLRKPGHPEHHLLGLPEKFHQEIQKKLLRNPKYFTKKPKKFTEKSKKIHQ